MTSPRRREQGQAVADQRRHQGPGRAAGLQQEAGSPSNQSYILAPADGPGGAKQVKAAFEGKDVAGLNNG